MFKSLKKLIASILDVKENLAITKWLLKLCRTYKRFILGFLLINLVTMLLSLAGSIAGRYVVDAATNYSSELFYKYIAIMLITTVVSIGISALSKMFTSYVNERFAFGIRSRIFDSIQRSNWYQISKYHSGDVLARLTSDVDNIASTLITLIPNVVVTAVQLVIVLFILFANDPVLAIMGLIIGPLGLVAGLVFRRKYIKYQKELRESQSEYYSFMQETLSKIGFVKTFQLEDKNKARFNEIRKHRMKLVLRSSVVSSIMSSAVRLIYSVGYVVTFSWCAYRLTTATIDADGIATFTYGTMTLFLSLVGQVQGSIRALGGIIPSLYAVKISAQRIREVSEIPNEDYSKKDNMPSDISLSVKNLGFMYESDEGYVLKGVTFDIPARSHVGIIGTSGTGKTTFIRMMLSLIAPTDGSLEYVDENGNREKASAASRRFISYVPQGNTLMSGTVRTNLLSGKDDATEEEMWEALRFADAEDFLKKNPNGLDTALTEGAGGISEGQAQRIAIARALLRNKPLLILDEATSALDEKTESNIFEKLSRYKDRTCFIITHRRSMLRYCDYILEISDDGGGTLSKNGNQ